MLVVEVSADEAEIAADLLWSAGAQAVEEIRHTDRVELLTDLGDDPLAVWSDLTEQTPAARPWKTSVKQVARSVVDTWRDHVEDISIGRVRVVPAWKVTDADAAPSRLLIDPGGAFGMGDHPTTRATLELALARTEESQSVPSVLDIGCGSGILGIALARMFGARVVAVDIAPAAIEATTTNVSINGVSESFVIVAGGVDVVRGTYDLVLANILAPVLLADSERIALCVASRGGLILSGFTSTRVGDVEAAYRLHGLRSVRTLEVDGWLAVEMERA